MKTNEMTLSPASGQSLVTGFHNWLSTTNNAATHMMGCTFTNLQFYGLILSGVCMTVVLILFSAVSFSASGWIAFFALSGIVTAYPAVQNLYQHSELD